MGTYLGALPSRSRHSTWGVTDPWEADPTYSKYSAAGVVLKLSLRPRLPLVLPERVSEQLGLFQELLQWVQGSSVVKEEKK